MTETFDPYYKWLGIGPEEQPPHHYRLLGVRPFEADADVIEAAADRQMAHLQTYRTSKHAALSQKLLNEVASAKLCLLDPTRKAAYDAELRTRFNPAPASSLPLPQAILLPVAPFVPPAATAVLPTPPTVRAQPTPKAAAPWTLLLMGVGAVVLVLIALIAWNASSNKRPTTDAEPPVNPNPMPGVLPTQLVTPKLTPPSWTKGAVLALTFDESAVINRDGEQFVRDLSGQENHAAIHSPTFVAGQTGQAVKFKTAQQYVEVAHQESLMPTDTLTLAIWIKAEAWRSGLTSGCLISKDDWAQRDPRGYVLRGGAGGRVDVTIGASGWISASSPSSDKLPVNTWHHLAATYDRDTLRLYVNGAEIAATANAPSIRPSKFPLRIGTGTYAKERHFVGAVDEVAIWNRALTADEVRALYETSIAGRSYCQGIGMANEMDKREPE